MYLFHVMLTDRMGWWTCLVCYVFYVESPAPLRCIGMGGIKAGLASVCLWQLLGAALLCAVPVKSLAVAVRRALIVPNISEDHSPGSTYYFLVRIL